VFSILILPLNKVVTAGAGESVLEAATAGAVQLPSACRNGTCRACICHLAVGTVGYRVAWPGLSAEEKVSGAVLPCVAEPLSDLVLNHEAATLIVPGASESVSDALRRRGF
jgi:ferredoxin